MNFLGSNAAAECVQDFMQFLHQSREFLKSNRVSERDESVQQIRHIVEEHYLDDQGKPSMYQKFESVFYDDAPNLVTLWQFFDRYPVEQLKRYQQYIRMELNGLTGDRHPRKVFDRSLIGVIVLIVGTITVWMTFLQNYTGENLSELMELIRFNWVAGLIWIAGLFVVLWFILKISRNNGQVAFVASVARALDVYLMECENITPPPETSG